MPTPVAEPLLLLETMPPLPLNMSNCLQMNSLTERELLLGNDSDIEVRDGDENREPDADGGTVCDFTNGLIAFLAACRMRNFFSVGVSKCDPS
nr:hypothetical protein Itr_chr07CG05760 [Ipomoea trifida]